MPFHSHPEISLTEAMIRNLSVVTRLVIWAPDSKVWMCLGLLWSEEISSTAGLIIRSRLKQNEKIVLVGSPRNYGNEQICLVSNKDNSLM